MELERKNLLRHTCEINIDTLFGDISENYVRIYVGLNQYARSIVHAALSVYIIKSRGQIELQYIDCILGCPGQCCAQYMDTSLI